MLLLSSISLPCHLGLSCVSGYRHVYLEGIEEASIFVHVAINDICGKVSAVSAVQYDLCMSMNWQDFVSH